MSWKRRLVSVIAGVLAVVLVMAWWRTSRSDDLSDHTQASPAATATAAGDPSASSPGSSTTASSTPNDSPSGTSTPSRPGGNPSTASSSPAASSSARLPAECSTTPGPMVPTRISIGDVAANSSVLSLGLAGDGTVATPPYSQPMSVGWYNLGPKPGADKGKVVLTAHTFRNGGGLGNAMHASGGLEPGDIIRVTGKDGRTLCYRHTGQKKVWVKDYDPDSTVLYDAKGKHQLAIVICWDFDRQRETWDSRVIYYAEPLAA
ncbi:class F sortase [Luteococcus sp. Sow4_B9]|uniref:class F sortase n=1 Tax=Luteococcus sp. Sow4_B9 TaxID=3438792 RepID=UPI003F995E6B